MTASSLFLTTIQWVLQLAALTWCVLTIARAVRRRPVELLVAHCRACSYPIPTAGHADRCPECGNSLSGTGTVAAREGVSPPPGRLRSFVACVLLVGAVWASASVFVNRYWPVETISRYTTQDCYHIRARDGSPNDAYTATLEIHRDGPLRGPPDCGTLTLSIAGPGSSLPKATFDLVTHKLLSSSEISTHLGVSSTIQEVVTAVSDAAELSPDDASRKVHARRLAQVTDSYLQSAQAGTANPARPTLDLPGDIQYSQHSYSTSSPLYRYRGVFGKRIDRDLLDCIAFVLGLLASVLLYTMVNVRARRARTAEWTMLRSATPERKK